jgi:pyruvate formate lyase activating enzyme
MIIGGMRHVSLIDYPGHIASVIFLAGCNFKCPYCHNADLVNYRIPSIPIEYVQEKLTEKASFLDGVVITGGEPTINQELPELCRMIKALGLNVKLDTNGSNIGMLELLLKDGLLDYIALDVKTVWSLYLEYVGKADIEGAVKVVKWSGIPYEFRTTCVSPLVTDGNIHKIGKLTEGAELCYLQACRHDVMTPLFFKTRGSVCTPDEIRGFQTIMSQYVKRCEVR